MAWQNVQMVKMLKIGGIIFIQTVFSYSSHERPWHFFHFTDIGLEALFNPIGIETIEAGMNNPVVGRYSKFARSGYRFRGIGKMYANSYFLGRKTKEISDLDWQKVGLEDITSKHYPYRILRD